MGSNAFAYCQFSNTLCQFHWAHLLLGKTFYYLRHTPYLSLAENHSGEIAQYTNPLSTRYAFLWCDSFVYKYYGKIFWHLFVIFPFILSRDRSVKVAVQIFHFERFFVCWMFSCFREAQEDSPQYLPLLCTESFFLQCYTSLMAAKHSIPAPIVFRHSSANTSLHLIYQMQSSLKTITPEDHKIKFPCNINSKYCNKYHYSNINRISSYSTKFHKQNSKSYKTNFKHLLHTTYGITDKCHGMLHVFFTRSRQRYWKSLRSPGISLLPHHLCVKSLAFQKMRK